MSKLVKDKFRYIVSKTNESHTKLLEGMAKRVCIALNEKIEGLGEYMELLPEEIELNISFHKEFKIGVR